MRLSSLLVIGLIATPVLAKDKKPVDPNKRVCRSVQTTGSMLGGKSECHTVEQWKAIDSENSERASQFTQPLSNNGGMKP